MAEFVLMVFAFGKCRNNSNRQHSQNNKPHTTKDRQFNDSDSHHGQPREVSVWCGELLIFAFGKCCRCCDGTNHHNQHHDANQQNPEKGNWKGRGSAHGAELRGSKIPSQYGISRTKLPQTGPSMALHFGENAVVGRRNGLGF